MVGTKKPRRSYSWIPAEGGYLDDAILRRFKGQSEKTGKGYQTLINDALKSYLGLTDQPIAEELVRKIVREELAAQS